MRAYSADLRWRVVRAWKKQGLTWQGLAERFSVSVSFVRDLLRLYRQTGSVEPRGHRGGHPRALSAVAAACLRAQVEAVPDLTLAEHAERLAQAGHGRLGVSTVWRALEGLGFPRKKRRSARASGMPRPSPKRATPT
jgi:transposase